MLFIVIVLVIITGVVIYGVFVMQRRGIGSTNNSTQDNIISLATPPVNLGPSYKSSVQNSWDAISLALSTKNSQELSSILDSLMAQKVPANFKELHIKLVLALSDAQDAIPSNNEAILSEVNQTLLNIEKEYLWVSL